MQIPKDEDDEHLFEDFICQGCATICSFLTYYPQLITAPNPSTSENEKGVYEIDPPVSSPLEVEKENRPLDSSANSETIPAAESKSDCKVKQDAGPSSTCIIGIDLARHSPTTDPPKPLFLSRNWRESLCTCKNCTEFYVQKGIAFVTDKEDTIAEYEKKAQQLRDENIQKQEGAEMSFFNNLHHVAKMELLSGINDMKNEFCAFMVCIVVYLLKQ